MAIHRNTAGSIRPTITRLHTETAGIGLRKNVKREKSLFLKDGDGEVKNDMAGIMGFFDKYPNGTGGKLILFTFDDATYEEIEEKLSNTETQDQVDAIFKRLKEEAKHCIFAEIDLDSL